jgi:hypothetical protein
MILLTIGISIAGEGPGEPDADLGGITVRSDRFPSGTVTLRNGEYHAPAAPGSAVETVVTLTDRRAFGALNGRDAAVVVIVTDRGGSGTFSDLALLIKGGRGWINADTVALGDRVKVRSLGFRDHEVIAAMTVHGPGDALCCPTQEITRRFRIQDDRLVVQREEDGAAPRSGRSSGRESDAGAGN